MRATTPGSIDGHSHSSSGIAFSLPSITKGSKSLRVNWAISVQCWNEFGLVMASINIPYLESIANSDGCIRTCR